MLGTQDGSNQEFAIPVIEVDAYAPAKMADKVGMVGVTKSRLSNLTLFALSILAGVFIALGTQLWMLVTHTATSNYGLNQLVGGMAFTLALVLIVIAGAELFTGNCLIAMSFMARKISGKDLARNLIVAFIGNFIGALTLVLWIYNSGQWAMNNHLLGAKIVLAANDKVNIPFGAAFSRGVLCNALVCLGIWLCYSARSNLDKIFALIGPISCLIASGFEHCVVNMWLIPMAIVLKGNSSVLAAAEKVTGGQPDLSNLTFFKGFLIDNMVPVTLGNLFGGIVLVAGVYWFVYLRPVKKELNERY
ncbi:MAG: formate/nitrite transporter family protein [Candidatus Loosdrechtia sp.]|uniref:formate/nitrite transporter family protein n=1 Tax=Candidatus Loosdrechtia sp. TaxID=3101272 RepID=UPI003A67D6ED|nr:MAG: formate/nitrite transporter family protein [Candidatus Jettenia sp. AMX2]